jgi:hypothetical protein
MIDRGKWYWCGLCSCPTFKCDECQSPMCNGGGCEYCADLHEVWYNYNDAMVDYFTNAEVEAAEQEERDYMDSILSKVRAA